MYVVAQHQITDPDTAFTRGEQLIRGEGAPDGARVLQFYPSRDAAAVNCLWEAGSAEQVQTYVDKVMGDSSENLCYEVNADKAFARRPLGLPESPSAQ